MRDAGILITYALITILVTSPFVSITNLGANVIYDGDPALGMWKISWVNHALLTQPFDLFAANTFYPAAGSLSFSEHASGLAILVHPWYWFSDNPVVPYNLLFLFSYFASAIGMYWLCRRYTGSRWAAFIGGLIFGFCFFRAHHFGHLSLIANQWFPFLVLLFHKLHERFRWPLAAVWVLLLVLQCLTNWYNAAFVILILAWIATVDLVAQHRLKTFARFAGCAAVAALLILPFYIPYARAPQPGDYAENKAFAADLGAYFEPPLNTLAGQYLQNTDRWIWEERSIFIGFIPLALAVGAVLIGRPRRLVWTYASLGLFAFILSLGPESLDFPGWTLPATYVYKLAPPLAKLRAVARFSIIVMFCVSVLAALFVRRLLEGRTPARSYLLIPLISAGILLEYFPVGLGWDPKTAEPFKPRLVDVWLKQHNPPAARQRDRKVVLEIPDYIGTPQHFSDAQYMLYSTQHWMNLANGYTRYYPPDYVPRMQLYSKFPAQEAIQAMKEIGIDYLVIHSEKFSEEQKHVLRANPLIVATLGSDWIYEIRKNP